MSEQIHSVLASLNKGLITPQQAASQISSIVINYAFEKDQRASDAMQLAFEVVLSPSED